MITQGRTGNIATIGLDAGKVYPLPSRTKTTLTSTSHLTLPNSAGKYLKLSLAGASEQDSTTGAQLIDFSADNWENGGINGTIGTDEANQNVIRLRTKSEKRIPVQPNTPYTISRYNLDYCVAIRFYDSKGAFAGDTQGGEKINGWVLPPNTNTADFTITTNGDVAYARMLIGKGDATKNISLSDLDNIKIQLQEGATAKPWEPYTGGKASPSPEYPQPIWSVGKPLEPYGYKIDIQVSDGADQHQTATIYTKESLRGIGDYRDTICKQGGVWGIMRRNHEMTMLKSGWVFSGETSDHYEVRNPALTDDAMPDGQIGKGNYLCNYFAEEPNCRVSSWGKNIYVRFHRTMDGCPTNIDEANAWIAGHDVKLVYALATPTWELLDDATQASLNALAAYKGTTMITVDSGEVCTTITATYKKKGT